MLWLVKMEVNGITVKLEREAGSREMVRQLVAEESEEKWGCRALIREVKPL